jgi:L-asparagine transporter-like permease
MMPSGDWIVGLIAMLMVLALNWRAVRSQNLSWPAMLRMMLIWGVIILGLVLLVRLFQA